MNEQPRNLPQTELFTRIITPRVSRRSVLLGGTSALLLAAMKAGETVASPLLRPIQPDSQTPTDYSAKVNFLGDIDLAHQLQTHTGGFSWNIDQEILHQAIDQLRPLASRSKIAMGLAEYVDYERDLMFSFGISVSDKDTTMMHFPTTLPDGSLYGFTKPLNPGEVRRLQRIDASWKNANPSQVTIYDQQGTPLPFNGTNHSA